MRSLALFLVTLSLVAGGGRSCGEHPVIDSGVVLSVEKQGAKDRSMKLRSDSGEVWKYKWVSNNCLPGARYELTDNLLMCRMAPN